MGLPSSATCIRIVHFVPREEPASKAPLLCRSLFVALLAVLFVLPSCPASQLFSLQRTSHQVKSVKVLGANRTPHHLFNRERGWERKGYLAFPG